MSIGSLRPIAKVASYARRSGHSGRDEPSGCDLACPVAPGGELTDVWAPDEAHEALRDLVRAREAAVEDLRCLSVSRIGRTSMPTALTTDISDIR